MSSRIVGNTTTVLPICAFRKKPELEINYLFISVSPSEIHFLKYQKTRRKIGQKTRGPVKFYAAASFTSYFVSCFPIFQEMENTWPHEILRGHVTYLIKSKLIALKLIIDKKLKLLLGINCIWRGRTFTSCFPAQYLVSQK